MSASPIAYPGLGLDIRHYDEEAAEIYPIGIHFNCVGSESEILFIREVAMMIVMNELTEKPDWHVKVFDDKIAEKWIEEALALPTEPLYHSIVPDGYIEDCPKCIEELRSKAKFFEKTGLVPTLDACASIVKADGYIDESLRQNLQAAFAKLKLEQKDDPDWHPNSIEMVQDLVHPSMYPLIYGRSLVFHQEVVGVEDAIDRWSGKGEVIPKTNTRYKKKYCYDDEADVRYNNGYWSDTYQWLPSNVGFQDDGSVKFTSYINGLHPTKHREIYATIEKLIEKALPAWDFSIPRYHAETRRVDGACRTGTRLYQLGSPCDENEDNWSPPLTEFLKRDGLTWKDEDGKRSDEYWQRYEEWEKMREPVQPEAPQFWDWDYGTKPGESLRERFQDGGIQVIVKMASIELTPDKPAFPAGGWHVEGQMNEHIVGTALYYLDSENVTSSHLDFRMQTDQEQGSLADRLPQDSYTWMNKVFGTNLGGASCLQHYGRVETKEGRLLAFPNVFHHRVSPFELQDKTKPGHRRFIALWLIDPLTRIINTGNVPPQQHSWWMERAFRNPAAVQRGIPLPPELMDMVKEEVSAFATPISLQEAKEHRLKLMEERSRSKKVVDGNWRDVSYNFCEH
ncbi:hypothetical protein NXS19_012949 [Fusarium pseudograminearum]|nr:hypothetical protein NXS19_012949 [Fusarium pseudograminearum]